MTYRNLLPSIVICAAISGCGPSITVPPLAPHEIQQIDGSLRDPQGFYRVTPGDVLDIRYPFHPEMSQREIVRSDGKIRAAEIGEVPVAGLTAREIAAHLAERTADRLRDPEVVVTITEYAPRSVYVAGEVARPGPIPYRRGLTPLQAIAQARGLLPTALTRSVVLVRATGPDGRTISRTLDLDGVLHDGDAEILVLAPHDVVFVPKTGIAEANVWVDQHFTQIFPIFRGVGPGSMNLAGDNNN